VGFGHSPAWFAGPLLAAAPTAFVLWWAAGRSWARLGALLSALLGLFGLGLGAVLMVWGVRGTIAGDHWSRWEFPSLPGFDGRDTTVREVLAAGIIFVVAAGQSLVVSAMCWRRLRATPPRA
jgi:hypothetical protein